MKTAAVLLTVMAGVLAVVIGIGQGIDRALGGSGGPTSAEALAEIPPHVLALYQQAATTCGGLPCRSSPPSDGQRVDTAAVASIPTRARPCRPSSARRSTAAVSAATARPSGTLRCPAAGPERSARCSSSPPRSEPGASSPPAEGASPDPHNAWDAIFTAARYLCGGKAAITDLRGAIFRYNHSQAYVTAVMDTATRYGLGAASNTTDRLLLATVRGITVNARIADQTAALLAAAEANGIRLTGGGYRSQITLRRAHCGPTPYDIYQRPAGQCRPPTAPPGQSFHEQGLAIDFTCDGHLIVSRGDRCFLWLNANAAASASPGSAAKPGTGRFGRDEAR